MKNTTYKKTKPLLTYKSNVNFKNNEIGFHGIRTYLSLTIFDTINQKSNFEKLPGSYVNLSKDDDIYE